MDEIKVSWYMILDMSLVMLSSSVGVLIQANKFMSLFLSLS